MARLDFERLGVTAPVAFQEGVIFLEGYGCRQCGHGFWVELDHSLLKPHTPHPCPNCSVISLIPGRRTYGP